MRENLARLVVIITGILVVMLSMLFSQMQNPEKTSVVDSNFVTEGKHLFQQQGCVRCHSFKEEGNQRNQLDGVTEKYTDKELRDWITGAQTLEGKMNPGIMKLKSKYQKLPEEELAVLVQYLALE